MRNRDLVLVGFLLACALIGRSQPYNFRFHSYAGSEVKGSTIYSITEDAYGFLWVGTERGLRRYDSHRFQAVGESTLQGQSVYDLAFDKNQRLWIAASNGAFIFDPKFQTLKNVAGAFGVELTGANSIAFFKQEVWIGNAAGVLRIDLSDSISQRYSKENEKEILDNEIFDLVIDDQGNVYIATIRGGLTVFEREADRFVNYQEGVREGMLSSNNLRHLHQSADGNIYVGTESNGLNVFDPVTKTFELLDLNLNNYNPATSSAYSIYQDNEDRIWIGTWANGLMLIDEEADKSRRYIADSFDPFSISGNFVISTFQSSSGDIWFGTYQTGLFRLSPEENKITRFTQERMGDGLQTNVIRSVLEDEAGNVWIGTGQEGLYRYSYKKDDFNVWLKSDGSREAMARGTIWSMNETADQSGIWLGTSRGVGLLEKATGEISFYVPDANGANSLVGNNVLKVLEHKGSLWVGTWYGGLNRLDLATGKWTYFGHDPNDPSSLGSKNVNDIFIDSKEQVWIATDEGVSKMKLTGETYANYDVATLMITEDTRGNLFICSADQRLLYLDHQSNQFVPPAFLDKLIDPKIGSMLVDKKGDYWLHSESGVDHYFPVQDSVIHFSLSDGIASNSTMSRAAALGASGKIYFGSRDGLTVIDPLQPPYFLQPSLVFTEFLLLNEPVQVSDTTVLSKSLQESNELVISYADYIFGFEFTALDFRRDSDIRYRYKLKGFDKNWISAQFGEKRATYTNVPPGSYIFQVEASHLKGRWQPVRKELNLMIVPPWWETTWAIMLFVGGGVVLVVGLIQARVSSIKKQKRKLEEEVAQRTKEIEQQKDEIEEQARSLADLNSQKNQLIGIIAHDIRNPLSSLKSLTDILDPSILKEENLAEFRAQLSQKIENLSGSIVTLLDWAKSQMDGEAMQVESIDLRDLVREVAYLYEVTLREKEIMLRSAVKKGTSVSADKNQIRAVFRNLIGNAIKFTGIGGTIEIHCKGVEPDHLEIEVRDSGIGMEQEKADKVFSNQIASTQGTQGEQGVGLGLMLVKDFVEKNKGQVWVKSKKGLGTSFFFTLPT